MDTKSWHLQDWSDLEGIGARLANGESATARSGPGLVWTTPLHVAAEKGDAAAMRLLLAHAGQVDVPDSEGLTPLWQAVAGLRGEIVRVLLDAGADPWRPCVDEWTPGRLALTTELAPMVDGTPGAVPLSASERIEQTWADRLIGAFSAERIHTDGLHVTFTDVADEDEVIRRIGGDPASCPVLQQDPDTDQRSLFDEVGLYAVGVTGTAYGCVVSQPFSLELDQDELSRRLSPATAYCLNFNPKGGVFGTLYRSGKLIWHEEIGPRSPFPGSPPEYWRYRFWQRPGTSFSHDANLLAYACARGGIRKAGPRDAWALSRGPRRIVRCR